MTIKTATTRSATDHVTNPWGSSLDKLKEWDLKGAELLLQVGMDPWTSGVLPRKEVELIYLALNCACTNLDEEGSRRQIRAALDAAQHAMKSSSCSSVASDSRFIPAPWAPPSCLRR